MPLSITNDGGFDIATGQSRRETSWKNREMQWSDLLKKLSTTHRTAETFAEYMAAKKVRQDEIKDIGGFVGGYLTGGKRKSSTILRRQLITLDIDFGTPDTWNDFEDLYDCTACIYSTHKHSPEAPRLRLIIPLNRFVFPDEYVAISRRIAGNIGIEAFDHTTFEPERLMYWPSTAKDAGYVFKHQDGPWLDADEVLSSYHDWKDSSEWPVSQRYNQIIQRNAKKQGDPLEKPGVIGAFCRTYSIAEAIETFLSDEYEECAVAGRYSYKHGSTAGGLVVYDERYAYSHHGTDPISGKLCNAFDLVRLHKYGLKDEDAREGTPVNKMPSYTSMMEFATGDKKTKKAIAVELMETAKDDFINVEASVDEPDNDDWKGELEVDKKKNFVSSIDNIFLVLKNDPKLKHKLYLNEFEGRIVVKKDLPWRKVTKNTRDFTDDDVDCLAHYLEGIKMPFTHVQKALAKIRTEFKIHPVREYLNSVKWDGEPRLETMLIDYLGAEDTDYIKAATRITFIGAVARIFEPGCKFDTVLTFVGKEGIGKSTLIAKLGREWFSDCLGDIHTKEGMENLRGVWIMEIAELASLRRADQEAIKRFITSREDIYRPAYGKQLVRYLRQCIFIASTNDFDFLKGSHVHRRFLPVSTHVTEPTKDVFKDLDTEEINQIWAEAVHLYKSGESYNLPEELLEQANKVREEHTEMDDRRGLIEKYISLPLPKNWNELSLWDRREFINNEESEKGVVERDKVCVAEVWCEMFGGNQRDMTSHNTKYIHDILKRMKNWKAVKSPKRFSLYGSQRAYVKDKIRVNANVNAVVNGQKNVNAKNANVNAKNS